MKVNAVFNAHAQGHLTSLDLGVWCFLSWHSDRAGLYTDTRAATASRLSISVRQLKSCIERLARAGVVSVESARGRKGVRWIVNTKTKAARAAPDNVVSIKKTHTAEGQADTHKPDLLQGLPF